MMAFCHQPWRGMTHCASDPSARGQQWVSLYLLNQVTVTSIFLSISFNCSVKREKQVPTFTPGHWESKWSPNGARWAKERERERERERKLRLTGETGKNRFWEQGQREKHGPLEMIWRVARFNVRRATCLCFGSTQGLSSFHLPLGWGCNINLDSHTWVKSLSLSLSLPFTCSLSFSVCL